MILGRTQIWRGIVAALFSVAVAGMTPQDALAFGTKNVVRSKRSNGKPRLRRSSVSEKALSAHRGLRREAKTAIQNTARSVEEVQRWQHLLSGKTAVIKLGGSVMKNERAFLELLADVVHLSQVGMRPVIVHGGQARISAAMEARGIKPKFVLGRRVTDAKSLEIVQSVLTGLSREIVDAVTQLGGFGVSLSPDSSPVLRARKLVLQDKGMPVDLGLVGRVTSVDQEEVRRFSERGIIPVIPSLGVGPRGQVFNVNADTGATAVARFIGSDKLVALTDQLGVLTEQDKPETLIRTLTPREARRLIKNGVIAGGMIPKIQDALSALKKGVGQVHIIDGGLPHSLTSELFTDTGIGTQIVPEPRKQVGRKTPRRKK